MQGKKLTQTTLGNSSGATDDRRAQCNHALPPIVTELRAHGGGVILSAIRSSDGGVCDGDLSTLGGRGAQEFELDLNGSLGRSADGVGGHHGAGGHGESEDDGGELHFDGRG